MRNGDVVKVKEGYHREGHIGMIIYRKGNFDIWVCFAHYHLSLHQKPELSPKERVKYLRHFGPDDIFTSEQLEVCDPFTIALDKLRETGKTPIEISSGYRSVKVQSNLKKTTNK